MNRKVASTCNPVKIYFVLDPTLTFVLYMPNMGDFLTVQVFARKLGIKPSAVYMALKDNRVQSVVILGRIGIPKSELRKFKRRENGIETKVLRKSR